MKFPLSWLGAWIELPAELERTQALLMQAGLGLESVDDPGASLRQVVVARVVKRDKHPDADKLSLCQVDAGEAQPLTIVCGAQNYKEGDLVPLAKEGAVLPGGFAIKRSKIRGQESFGMLCSAKELGLAEEAEGLLILDPALKPGTPLVQALSLDDPVLTLETTANRPDHLSVRGLARELSALLDKPLTMVEGPLKESGAKADFKVATLEPTACPLYMARVLRGVKIAPSPAWLRQRLERAGLRSINNVVDATNHVLLEYGQPMHAFDIEKLSGGALEARLAKPGERLVTLDGQDRELSVEDLVIADAKGPQALAGVMGGAQSQVAETTTGLVLEAAVFASKRVRRTSRRLGLISQSSLRFERGVDARSVAHALDRCAALILSLAGGEAAPGSLRAGQEPAAPAPIAFELAKINALLGTSITQASAEAALRRRGFKVEGAQAQPPAWRQDLSVWQDLAEELLQVLGLETVPKTDLPEVRMPDPDALSWDNAWLLRELCVGLGLREAQTLSYMDPKLATQWGLAESLRMDNPLSEEQSLLRPSLLPNLVDGALASLRRGASGVALFELGRIFEPKAERDRLALLLCGLKNEASWAEPEASWDGHDLRAMLEKLAGSLRVTLNTEPGAKSLPGYLHPGQSVKVRLGPAQGWMGALHPALQETLGAERAQVWVVELDASVSKSLRREPAYKEFSRLPDIGRDISCLMDEHMEAGKVLEFLRREGGMDGTRVKDLYQGANLPAGKKSLTFSLVYSSTAKTLTDAEVNQRHEDLLRRLEQALPVEVRR